VTAAQAMAEWSDFYVALAGAAAVLLGLVFVALSIHIERPRGELPVRGLAIEAGSSLFYPLLIALVMLVPAGRPGPQAVLLLLIAVFGLLTTRAAYAEGRARPHTRMGLVFRFVVPLGAMIGLVAAAVGLALDWEPGVWLVAAVALVHVIVGTQNAWDLVLGATPRHGQ
jgi:hypothetical protein